jgi:hypothetical protein
MRASPPGRPPAAERGPDRPGDQRRRPEAALTRERKLLTDCEHLLTDCCLGCSSWV